MFHIILTEQEIDQVKFLRYEHPDPKIQRRLWVIWLKHQGRQHTDIEKITDVHHDTVTEYIKMFNEGAYSTTSAGRFYPLCQRSCRI